MSGSGTYRRLSLGTPGVKVERDAQGRLLLKPTQPLGAYPRRLTDRLLQWAAEAPDRTFMAKRERGGGWRGTAILAVRSPLHGQDARATRCLRHLVSSPAGAVHPIPQGGPTARH